MATAVASTAITPVAQAQEPPELGVAAQLADGLASYVSMVAGLGAADELAARIPLARHDVREVLGVPSALAGELLPALQTASTTADLDLGRLIETVEGAGIEDDDEAQAAGVAGLTSSFTLVVEERDVDGDGEGDGDGVHDVTLGLRIQRKLAVPVSHREVEYRNERGQVVDLTLDGVAEDLSDEVLYEDPVIELRGGEGAGSVPVTVVFDLSTELTFTEDPDGGRAGLLVADDLAAAEISAKGATSDLSLSGRVGLATVEATGRVAFSRRWTVRLTDPDNVGGIRRSDWEVSLPAAVLPITSVDGDAEGPDVDVELTLESPLTPASPDGTLTWTVADASNAETGEEAPTVSPGDELLRFREVTPSDLLSGLTKYGALVSVAESRADVPVPFTDTSLRQLVGAGEIFLETVQRQGAALVLCGRTDTNPPVGGELSGSAWYCQAYARGEAESDSIEWTVAQGTIADASTAGSVGTEPSTNVQITGVEGLPQVTVSWTDEATGEELTANRRFETVTELSDALAADLVGLDAVERATVAFGQLRPDANTLPLSIEVVLGGSTASAAFAPGDDFASHGLRGLVPVPDAGPVAVQVGEVVVGSELEIDMAARSFDPTARIDRFRLRSTGEPLLSIASLSADVPEEVDLVGRVGYVRTRATARGFDLAPGSDSPIAEVSVRQPEGSEPGTPVSLAETLPDPVAALEAVLDLRMEQGSLVAAAGDPTDPLFDGPTLGVTWDDVSPASTPVLDPDEQWSDLLVPLDVTPEVTGRATADDDAGFVLTDEGGGFLTAFGAGVSADDEIVAQLINVTTGASCSRFVVVDDTSLRCTDDEGLEGGTRIDPETGEPIDQPSSEGRDLDDVETGDWRAGDAYLVNGDLAALGGLVAEGWVDVLKRLTRVQDQQLDDPVPLIGVTPLDLLPQLPELEEGIAALLPRIAINGDRPGAKAGLPPTEDPGSVPPADAPPLAYLDELGAAVAALRGDTVRFTMEDLARDQGSDESRHLVATITSTREGTRPVSLQTRLGTADQPFDFGTDVVEGVPGTPVATWRSTIVAAVAVPIDQRTDPGALLVHERTGVQELTVTLDSETLDLTGRFGSLRVLAGAAAAARGEHVAPGGTHTGGPVAAAVVVSGIPGQPADGEPDTSTTQFETTDPLPDVDVDDVVSTSVDGAPSWCAISAVDVDDASGTSTVTCAEPLTGDGTFAPDDTVAILQAQVVTTTDDVSEVDVGQSLLHPASGASCTVDAVNPDAGTIACDGVLRDPTGPAPPAWATDDEWRADATSTKVLRAPGAGFDRLGLTAGTDVVREVDEVGATVSSCTIGEISATTLTCRGELSNNGSWAHGDRYVVGGEGAVGLDVSYTLRTDRHALLDVPADDADGWFDLVRGELAGTGADCDGAGTATRRACLRLSLQVPPDTSTGEPGRFLGTVEAEVASDGTESSSVPQAAVDAVAAEQLDLSLLGAPLSFLGPVVQDSLDGYANPDTVARDPGWSASEILLPLVGADLGAGAPVVETVDAVAAALGSLSEYAGDLGGLQSEIARLLGGAVLPEGVRHGTPVVTCGGTDCGDEPSVVEVSVVLGQNLDDPELGTVPTAGCAAGCGSATGKVRFDSGLPGMQISTPEGGTADLDAERAWRWELVVGVDKAFGPYVKVGPDQDLVVGARVTIPSDQTCSHDPGDIRPKRELFGNFDPEPGVETDFTDYAAPIPDGYLDASGGAVAAPEEVRCFDATVGLLQGTFYDGDTPAPPGLEQSWPVDPSYLDLRTAVDLRGAADPERLSVVDLVDRTEERVLQIQADANVDLYVVTGRTTPHGGDLPAVHASIHWTYDHTRPIPTASDRDGDEGGIAYRDVVIDLRSFVDTILAPWVSDALGYLGTIRPAVDVLLAEIPGISDAAEAIGNPPISLFTLAQEASGQDLTLVYNALQFIRFADTVGDGLTEGINSDDGYSGLNGPAPNPDCDNAHEDGPCGLSTSGGFNLDDETARQAGPCSEVTSQIRKYKAKKAKDCKKTTRTRSFGASGVGYEKKKEQIKQVEPCGSLGCRKRDTAVGMSRQFGTNLGTPGLGFPFLSDPGEMYGMLIGAGDAELIRLDLGSLAVDFGIQIDFGPFMAGPVPIDIGVGGNVTVEARAMLGFDTFGLRTTGELADGFFVHDFDPWLEDDSPNKDVKEITLTFTVTLSAAISVKFFKAGVKGQAQFIIAADINDPNNDGKLRPTEMGRSYGCAMTFTGDLRVIISVFVALDFKIWSKEWSYELFRRTWRLFESVCEDDRPPALAARVGVDVVLNAGPRASNRGISEDEVDESFIVRQVGPNRVSVEAFGLVMFYEVGAGGAIRGDMGAGDDNVVLAPGIEEQTGDEVLFTLPTDFTLGPASIGEEATDDDSFEGGDGADVVRGGAGRDVTNGGAGPDDLSGGAGDDSIDGGRGDDVLRGDAGHDRLIGAQGSDSIDGGAGDDDVQGGPGMAPAQAAYIAQVQSEATGRVIDPASLADGDDVLIGGSGADELSGNFGNDRIVGAAADLAVVRAAQDLVAMCRLATGADAGDVVDGGPGDDLLAGGAGDDRITGGRGADEICGGDGQDLLRGDGAESSPVDGADSVFGDDGDDTIDGGGGADTIDGGNGFDRIEGGPGNDTISGAGGTDHIGGGDGDDTIFGERDGTTSGTPGAIVRCATQVNVIFGLVADADRSVLDGARVDGVPAVGGYLDLNRNGSLDLDVLGGGDSGLLADVVVTDGRLDLDGNGTIDARDSGLLAVPVIEGTGDADCLFGGAGGDTIHGGFGDDQIAGEAGDDFLYGDDGADDVRGDVGQDTIRGGAGPDTLWGDAGSDVIHGDEGDDLMHGGGGGDTLTGGPGMDELHGESGGDRLVGGSLQVVAAGDDPVPGPADGRDVLLGGPGNDRLVGDNGTEHAPEPGEGASTVLYVVDLPSASIGEGSEEAVAGDCADPGQQRHAAGTCDLLVGGAGDDTLLGGLGDDELHGDGDGIVGDPGEDRLEGNEGSDTLLGGDRRDVLVGGTSPSAMADGVASGLVDGYDVLTGGGGNDVLVGDNGSRTGAAFDMPASGAAPLAGAGGSDELLGGDGDDTLLGGLHADVLLAGRGDDDLEGGHGHDRLDGEAGDDTLIGGASPSGVPGDARGLADGGDTLLAGAGSDLVVGDNGTRDGVVYDLPLTERALAGTEPSGSLDAGGGDLIDGGSGADTLLGGLGDDTVHGDGDAELVFQGLDVIEGNHGADTIYGDGGDDTILGGTSDAAADGGDGRGLVDHSDTILGGGGNDLIVGDNGTRAGRPHDLPLRGTTVDPQAGAGDRISGGDGVDRVRAGVGPDVVVAGRGDDDVEGNEGTDVLVGQDGDDVLIGGTIAADHIDAGDRIDGGSGDDVLLGDNGTRSDGVVTLFDVLTDPAQDTEDDTVSGGDRMDGGAGDDVLLGQGGPDMSAGGDGTDVIEGGHDRDVVAGGAGADDITGGGSAVDGVLDDERDGNGLLDGADIVHGDGPESTGSSDPTDPDVDLTGEAGAFTEAVRSAGTALDDGADVVAGDNAWVRDAAGARPGDGERVRAVLLFDVETTARAAGAGTSGDDRIGGGGGNDHLHGQGGDDAVSGHDGHDTIEGNHGDDELAGGAGDDDVVGGGSANDGALDDDRDPTGLLDGRDILLGDVDRDGFAAAGDGDDVLSGDNAWISRPVDDAGSWQQLAFVNLLGAQSFVLRDVRITDEVPGPTSGTDVLKGNGGHDELYGQFDDGSDQPLEGPIVCEELTLGSAVGDILCGGADDDALLGDNGTVESVLAQDVGSEKVIATAGRFAEATVFELDTLIRRVVLTQPSVGGADVLLGGAGQDALHGGAGNDIVNGGADADVVFGHDGVDALWGGTGPDTLYGGFGGDFIDVKPRAGSAGIEGDPPIWFEVAPAVDRDGDRVTTNGFDLHYGGEDADAMQADEATNGPADGDRLIDWYGAYNINYVCAATNGAVVYGRGPAPRTTDFLQTLATAHGLVDVSAEGSSGRRSLALVTDGNKNPPHPDTPGNFTCEGDDR